MIDDLDHARRLGQQWAINPEDVLLIALNSCGVQTSDLDVARARFRIRVDSRPDDQLYMILSLGRSRSPFELRGGEVLLNGRRVAVIDGIEDDDAVLGYWRNGHRALTLNSNARS